MPSGRPLLSLERELMSQIRQEQISNPNQFNEAVMGVFDDVIGSFGRAEFEQHVLPGLLPRRNSSYKTAGRRALRIIEEGSYKKRGEIAQYFTTVLGTPTVKSKSPRLTRKVRRREQARTNAPEYQPQLRIPPKFSSLTNQDRLAEGLLKTVDRGYISMGMAYSIGTAAGRHHFSSKQDRLQEGLIKFRYLVGIGEKSEWKNKYVSIDKVIEMKGILQETPGCFVATAVYGNPEAPQVQALRDFRDNVLIHNSFGRRFVDFYYSGAGQQASDFVRKRIPSAIPILRKGLDFLVENYSAKNK